MTLGSAGGVPPNPPPCGLRESGIVPVPCGEPGVYQVLLVEEEDTEGVVLGLLLRPDPTQSCSWVTARAAGGATGAGGALCHLRSRFQVDPW